MNGLIDYDFELAKNKETMNAIQVKTPDTFTMNMNSPIWDNVSQIHVQILVNEILSRSKFSRKHARYKLNNPLRALKFF